MTVHTCTYRGRSSTLHCLRICEWKNGLTHLADQQDFLRFFLRGLEEVFVCLSVAPSVCLLVFVYRPYQSVSLFDRFAVSLFAQMSACPTVCGYFRSLFSICLSVFLSVFFLSVCLLLFVYLSISMSTHLSACQCFCLTLSAHLSVLLPPSLSVCLSAPLMFVSLYSSFHLQYLPNCLSVFVWKNRQTAASFSAVSFCLSVT